MTFHELELPFEEKYGIHAGKWFVGTNKNLFLLNDLSYTLGSAATTEEGNGIFYFPSASDAFNCSAAYYMTHGVMYPYTDEWQGRQVKDNETQSQVMEFE